MIVDGATKSTCSVFLPVKSAGPVTYDFRTFLAVVNACGKPVCQRTDNGPKFTNREFQKLMSEDNIRREYTSVDVSKCDGRVEW